MPPNLCLPAPADTTAAALIYNKHLAGWDPESGVPEESLTLALRWLAALQRPGPPRTEKESFLQNKNHSTCPATRMLVTG